jgi:hypothetical protein
MYAPKRSNMPPSTKFVAEDYLRPAIEIFGKLKKLTIIIQWDATDQDMSFGPLVSSLAGSAESLVIEMEYFGYLRIKRLEAGVLDHARSESVRGDQSCECETGQDSSD